MATTLRLSPVNNNNSTADMEATDLLVGMLTLKFKVIVIVTLGAIATSIDVASMHRRRPQPKSEKILVRLHKIEC